MIQKMYYSDNNNFTNYDAFLNSNQQFIVLDPTELYEVPKNFILISNEIELLKLLDFCGEQYWIRGEILCNWTMELLRVWNKTSIIREIKQNPRSIIKDLLYPFSIPEIWTDNDCLEIAAKFATYSHENPIPYFLAEVTNTNLQKIWLSNPSKEHLAEWLTIQVPERWKVLESVWQNNFQVSFLSSYYQTSNKLQILRQWLELDQPSISELGNYPLPIPEYLINEFKEYWQKQIIVSEGKILDEIDFASQPESKRIAEISYDIIAQRPQWITRLRVKKSSPYLTHQQQQILENHQPPPTEPKCLSIDATPEQTLKWVTDEYLPFRRWEIVVKKADRSEQITENIAQSFIEWITSHYPELRLASADHSLLNYNVTHLVQKLCRESPVLWVVVDGLGWLDHMELLSYLTENQSLSIEQDLTPRFSILPTITKYAKWSLYAQLLPNSSQWKDDIKQGFNLIGFGKYYTDNQRDSLYSDLKSQSQSLYCWDTTTFDSLQHHQKDWQSFCDFERPQALKFIAERIHYCLNQYPAPDNLKIVIATDHGQILGQSPCITCSPHLEASGRMAKGMIDDPRFIVLDADRFELPYDMSIIRGSETFNAFSYTKEKQVIGSHGGLFPEEVVVGYSVLCKSVKRLPVIITCYGEGEASKEGFITVTIDNPNFVALTNLSLTIDQLPTLDQNQLLTITIPPNEKYSFPLYISKYPELPTNNLDDKLLLSGNLNFQYAQTEQGFAYLENYSNLTIKQLFSSGFNIDEFIKYF